MKILLTGITGFIGKHLSRRLLGKGHAVHAIIRKSSLREHIERKGISYFVDDGSTDALIDYFKNNKFDGVIHLASCFIVDHKPEEINDLIASNVLFSTRILEASVKSNVPWFINTGTFWQHYQNKDYSPVNLYAATKQAFQVIAQYYLETADINFVTLKLSDTFGPEDTRTKIFNLWHKIAKTGEILEMSPGEQLIDICYIDDVVDAYIHMMDILKSDTEKTFAGKSYAVSSDRGFSLKDLAALYSRVTKQTLNIQWGGRPYRKREVMIPWNKGERVPGWRPKVSIEEGLMKYRKITEEKP